MIENLIIKGLLLAILIIFLMERINLFIWTGNPFLSENHHKYLKPISEIKKKEITMVIIRALLSMIVILSILVFILK